MKTREKGWDISYSFSKHSPHIKLYHGVTRTYNGSFPKKISIRLSAFIYVQPIFKSLVKFFYAFGNIFIEGAHQ